MQSRPAKRQTPGRPVLLGAWARDEDFGVHPSGSKPKSMLICPEGPHDAPLIPGHAYLFKPAIGWRAQQMWSEVIAYRVGALVGLDVPPCFVGLNEQTGEPGALVEFFYGFPGEAEPARLVHASDALQRVRSSVGAERPHNVRLNVAIRRALKIQDAIEWWGRALVFDALIGNTDRHTQNWGFLVRPRPEGALYCALAPVFDNGTSLGYEQGEGKLKATWTLARLEAYLAKGNHHCGWDASEDQATPHLDLCGRFARTYPEAGAAMQSVIQFDSRQIDNVLAECVAYDVGLPFTTDRAKFVSALLDARRVRLAAVLKG